MRLYEIISRRIKDNRSKLKQLSESRRLSSPVAYLDDRKMELAELSGELEKAVDSVVSEKKQHLAHVSAMLSAVSPLNTIARGYCAVFRDDGTLVNSIDKLSVGEKFSFRASDGEIGGEVLYKKKFE